MPLVPIHTLIVEREIEHLCALQEAICQHTSALLRIADALAELDCLVALADAAAKFGWVRPEMEIYQGRHALQELTVDSFVPTDAYPQGAAARPLQMRCCMRIKTGHERWTKPAGHHRSEMSWQQHLREASGTLLRSWRTSAYLCLCKVRVLASVIRSSQASKQNTPSAAAGLLLSGCLPGWLRFATVHAAVARLVRRDRQRDRRHRRRCSVRCYDSALSGTVGWMPEDDCGY